MVKGIFSSPITHMPFTVRRVGGGTFNPNAMCISHDKKALLFIGCGNLINIYSLPDLRLQTQCTSHKAPVRCLACTDDFLVSADADGYIMIHNFNLMSIIDKMPSDEFRHKEPIEKIFIRSSQIYVVYYKKKMFWISDYSELKSPKASLSFNTSRFIIDNPTQKKLCDLHDSLIINEPTWLRFPQLDNFDIDETGTKIVMADECKLRVFDLMSKKVIEIRNLYNPCRICRFRDDTDYFVFMQNGRFQQFGQMNFSYHWHFVCPNAVCFDKTSVYSGGTEGVFLSHSQTTNRLTILPRIGMTIEGLAITNNSQYVAGVVDKNILVSIDPKANTLINFVSHVYGDIFFNGNIITSLRRPNLIQFFNSKNAECIEQLSISSFNCRVPVTSFALTQDYLITVETSEGESPNDLNEIGYLSPEENFDQEGLSMILQADFNHTKPHSDTFLANEIYKNMLTKRRFDEYRSMLKMRYGTNLLKEDENSNASNTENTTKSSDFNSLTYLADINFDINAKTVEGNPLSHDKDASICVGYSEVKIWSNKINENISKDDNNKYSSNFVLDQTFRIIGKKVSPLSMHPVLPVYAMVVARELQLWRLSDKWQLWKTKRLGCVPEDLVWSPDGSILVLQFSDRLEIFDVETYEIVFTKMFESIIVESSFFNDSLMIVHSKDGISLFDLRKLEVTKRIFAQSACCTSKDGYVAFVINKDQPIIVLSTKFDQIKQLNKKDDNNESSKKKGKRSKKYKNKKDDQNEENNPSNQSGQNEENYIDNNDDMKCWRLPTYAKVKALGISIDENNKISIIAVDNSNFIWMIDEYGIVEVEETRIKEITPVKPKEVTQQNRIEIVEDKTQLILDLIDLPSHQILPIDDLCAAMFGFIIDKRDEETIPSTITLKPEEVDEEIEEVGPLTLSPQDKTNLKQLFSS